MGCTQGKNVKGLDNSPEDAYVKSNGSNGGAPLVAAMTPPSTPPYRPNGNIPFVDEVASPLEGDIPDERQILNKYQEALGDGVRTNLARQMNEAAGTAATTVHQQTTITTDDDGNQTVRTTRSVSGGADPAAHGAELEDRFCNTSFQQSDLDPSNNRNQEAAVAIQSKYRQYRAQQEVDRRRKDRAAGKIQAGFRGFQDRKKVAKLRSQREADPATDQAASTIQSSYLGYKTRRDLQSEKLSSSGNGELDKRKEVGDNELDAAATRIQSQYRGYRARQSLTKQPSGDVDERQRAATRIQAQYRGYRSRKDLSPKQLAAVDERQKAATRIQSQYRGYRTRKDRSPSKLAAAEERQKAATRIQSQYRGYRTRKDRSPVTLDTRSALFHQISPDYDSPPECHVSLNAHFNS